MKTCLISVLCLFLFFSQVVNAQKSLQLTQNELNVELRKALVGDDEVRIVELIKNHRLFIKPFVDALVKESISLGLKGKRNESEQSNKMAAKTAEIFNYIFSEKSLLIAVNYLTIWSKEQKGIKLTADSIYAAGTKFRLGNEPEKAIDLFEKVLILYGSIGDERGEAEVLGGYGAVYYNNIRDFQAAFNYYEKALAKREKVDDKVLMGNTLSSIGSLYHDYFSDYPKAITYLSRAERIREESGDLVNLGRTIHVKASALEKNGQLDSALHYFARSSELNGQAGDKPRMAQAMLHSGEILNNVGRYPESLECLEKSVSLYKELKSRTEEGYAQSQIGFVFSNIGDLNSAIERINIAAGIMKEVNDPEGLAGVYNHFGIVLREAGRYEKALEYYLLSQEIYKQKGDKKLMLPLLSNIGNVYLDLKDYLKAEEYHKQGLQFSRELNASLEEVHLLLNLANDQIFLGRLDESLSSYETGLLKAESMNSPDLIWRFYVGMAENHERRGEYQKAVELNDSALKILGGMRNTLQSKEQKASFMASERYIYEDIISLLENLNEKDITKGYDKLAFKYAEESKSRVLLDLLAESEHKTASNLKNRSDSDNSGLHDPEPISIDEAKMLCTGGNMTILEYAVGDTSSCLWVINRSGYKLFRLPGRKELQEEIETIRFGLLDPNQGISDFFTRAGVILYEELISPAEPFLSRKSRLVIIPDGVLNYLPFEVLLTENGDSIKKEKKTSIPFLVKNYPVSYVQSASVLKQLVSLQDKTKNRVSESRKLLAFGDPLYKDTLDSSQPGYPRLEFSGKEIETIETFFKPASSSVYLRDRATEGNLKNTGLDKYTNIHFATHGLIDDEEPDRSSLVLADEKDSGEDGYLKASEIFDLNFNADLVVLSACQTGLGKLVRGEGMVGLTRAFMYAGTPSVVVSLWSVSDVSTASLMGEFYKNLIKDKLSKTDALRKAQLTLMSDEKYSHPFYWAPFILVGDWR